MSDIKPDEESKIGKFVESIMVRDKYENEWGAFRRFIAAHPLTGFWCGVAAGFAMRTVLGWIL